MRVVTSPLIACKNHTHTNTSTHESTHAHTHTQTHIQTYTHSLLILILIIIIIIIFIFIIFIAKMTENKNGLAKRMYLLDYQAEAREVLHCRRWQSAMVTPLVAGLWQKASVWVYLRRQTAIYLVYLFVLSLSPSTCGTYCSRTRDSRLEVSATMQCPTTHSPYHQRHPTDLACREEGKKSFRFCKFRLFTPN